MKKRLCNKTFATAVALLLALTGCSLEQYADAKFEADLVKASNETNKTLPMMIDKDTRLDSTLAGPGKEWTYLYTLVATDVKGITNARLNEVMGDKIRNSVCTMKEMELFVKHKVTMKYKYRDNDGNFIGEVIVKAGDCSNPDARAKKPD
ncbi:MAG: hypothetical protein ACREPB_11555 [Arenimonas sp.]